MGLFLYGCILGVLIGSVYAVMASGLALIWGVMRVLNIAQAAFVILGAYLAFSLHSWLHVDPMLAILPLVPVMFGFGMLMYYLFLRPIKADREALSVLVTYAIATGIEGLLGVAYSTNYRFTQTGYSSDTYDVLGKPIPAPQLYAFAAAIVVLALLAVVLKGTQFGRSLRAATQNPTGARLVGIEPGRVFAFGFGLGTATAAAAGSLYGMMYSFNPASHLDLIGVLLATVVLGGFGSMMGTVVAAVVLGVASSVVGVYAPLWSGITFFGVLAVVLLLRPQGLRGIRRVATT